MQKIMECFEPNRQHDEKEVNEILKGFYEDYVSVRRRLIEYGFLDRNKDGTGYRVKLY